MKRLTLALLLAAIPMQALAATPLAPKAVADYNTAQARSAQMSLQDFVKRFGPGPVMQAIESVADHGLNPDDYHLQELLSTSISTERKAELALDGWMSAASHVAFGKLKPTSVEPDWTAQGRQADLAAHLRAALAANELPNSLNTLAPKHEAYQSLRRELISRRSVSVASRVAIPVGDTLKPGIRGERVSAVQARLGVAETGIYDAATEAAVTAFQDRNNLDADGKVGPATLRALNRTGSSEINQLRVNLERWRWLPDELGAKHVRVNIADFSVQAWKDGRIERVHSGIVGKPFRKTPVFSDEIEYVVLNPWWETPASLARRDKLPSFRRDPSKVSKLGFQVLQNGQVVDASTIDWNSVPDSMPYRIRQAPGPTNALGQVKIIFPNKHNVYLHDTPDRGLFAQRQRAFSSGCIRTQDPLDLTAWLLDGKPGWDKAGIDAQVASGKERRVDLDVRVPVHVLYMTAVTDAAGVRLVDDIYDRDATVLAGLNAKP